MSPGGSSLTSPAQLASSCYTTGKQWRYVTRGIGRSGGGGHGGLMGKEGKDSWGSHC